MQPTVLETIASMSNPLPVIDTPVYRLVRGTLPLVVSVPCAGTAIPDEVVACMSTPYALKHAGGERLAWLVAFASRLGASVIQARISPNVIDLDHPDGVDSLCVANSTRLGEPSKPSDAAVDHSEYLRRVDSYWKSYHQALDGELQRLRWRFGQVVLWSAHSMECHPAGARVRTMPDLCFGTANGESCDSRLMAELLRLTATGHFSILLNQCIREGYATQRYGKPSLGIQVVQLGLSQKLSLGEAASTGGVQGHSPPIEKMLSSLMGGAIAFVQRRRSGGRMALDP